MADSNAPKPSSSVKLVLLGEAVRDTTLYNKAS